MKIGLTYTGSEGKHKRYVDWLSGQDIEVIKLSAGENGKELFEKCDALVLSGGIDMEPEFYHGAATYANMPTKGFDRARDQFEWDLFGKALDRSIPVLGICRGQQLINCYLHGDMLQDGGEPGNSIHRSFTDDKDQQFDRAHAVRVIEKSLLREIAGIKRGVVNSAHHQALGKLGEGLMASCYSDDDLIEAIEWADRQGKSFLLAVQWHPERMVDMNLKDSPLASNIRKRFIQEIKSLG